MGDKMKYTAPSVTKLGNVRSLTLQSLDKEGSEADFLTPIVPLLDGSFVGD